MPNSLSFQQVRATDDCVDVEGRPLGEHRAKPSTLTSVPMELRQCPYPDTRFHHERPMNVSALKQLSCHWNPAIGLIQALRARFEARLGRSISRTIDHLRIADAISVVPNWMVHRVDKPISDTAIPGPIAAMYKIIIGMKRLMQVYLAGELMGGAHDRQMSFNAADFWEYADMGHFLLGPEQVCGGSAKQIQRSIEALMFGTLDVPPADDEARAALVDEERFFDFAEHMFRFECAELAAHCKSVVGLKSVAAAIRDEAPKTASARLGGMFKKRLRSGIEKRLSGRAMGHRIGDALLGGPEIDLRKEVQAGIDSIDLGGTLQHFAKTRSADQLDELVQGWCGLAAGTPGQKLAGPQRSSLDHEWRGRLQRSRRPEPLLSEVRRQIITYTNFQTSLRPVLEREQAAMNAALGREPVSRPSELAIEPNLIDSLTTAFPTASR